MTRLSTDTAATVPAAVAQPTVPHPERFPWLPILVLGFAWFLAVAIELSPAGLLLPLTALAIRFARRAALNVVMTVFVVSNVAVALAPTIAIADIGRFVGDAWSPSARERSEAA